MLTLFLNFASAEKSMALVKDKKTVVVRAIENRLREDALMPLLEAMLAAENLSTNDLSRICAVTGPGGFMSLRVGIAFANALSWGLKIPLAGIHLSDLTTEQANCQEPRANCLLWLHSTKKDLLFVRDLRGEIPEWQNPTLISLEQLLSSLPATRSSLLFLGELIPEHRAALPNIEECTDMAPLPDVLPQIVEKQEYTDASLVPWYGRGA